MEMIAKTYLRENAKISFGALLQVSSNFLSYEDDEFGCFYFNDYLSDPLQVFFSWAILPDR